jgi:hypothetical protein
MGSALSNVAVKCRVNCRRQFLGTLALAAMNPYIPAGWANGLGTGIAVT